MNSASVTSVPYSSVPLFIGLRYTRSKRRNGFIAFVGIFALLGMALGVFSLIVVLSVMNGFDNELKDRILRVVPHGFLSTKAPLEDWRELAQRIESEPGLVASAPYIEGKGLIAYGGSAKALEIQGIVPDEEQHISLVDEYMLVGELSRLQPGSYGMVMGALLARYLGVTIGDRVAITLPEVSISPAGVFPRTKRFTVVGVFEVGAQVDQSLALIHIRDAQRLFRKGNAVDGLHLKFDDIYQAPQGVQNIARKLGNSHLAKDWGQTQGSLFQAVKMEKTVVGIMLSIIIAVAAFNIITGLVMMVAEKRSDIAVLRTLGMKRMGILAIFMIQGVATGVMGIAIGASSGILTAHYLPAIVAYTEKLFGLQLFDPSVYFVTYLPSQWRWEDSLVVCIVAIIVSFLATLYPAYRASRIAPAEALRYDI